LASFLQRCRAYGASARLGKGQEGVRKGSVNGIAISRLTFDSLALPVVVILHKAAQAAVAGSHDR
jgi:hypothetical protein